MKVIELICSCNMVWFLWLRGLPWAQSDPVASHLDVSSCKPVYWLRCSFYTWILRSWIDPAVMLTLSV